MSRWTNYLMADDLNLLPELLWEAGGREQRSAYLLAVGFDPRCLLGLQRFLAMEHAIPPLIVRLGLPVPTSTPDPIADALAATHDAQFGEVTAGHDVILIEPPSVHDLANLGSGIAKLIEARGVFAAVGHVIVDISSLPSTIYFPVIRLALMAGDGSTDDDFNGDVQVVACENPMIDAAIIEEDIEEVINVAGFRNDLDLASTSTGRRIWAPVLGERCGAALSQVFTRLSPDETCPILPFPAHNPRRGDALVLEHHLALFERFEVGPGNFVYADERNPFDLYRTLGKLQRDYKEALLPLGPTQVIVSSHSSKLLSLGVLLAAYEYDLPVVAASAGGHRIGPDIGAHAADTRVVSLWLSGRPYRSVDA